MDYSLSIAESGKFVIYRPEKVVEKYEAFVHRFHAASEFADRHHLTRFLLDFREQALSLDSGFFRAAVGEPALKSPRKWRLAILIAPASSAQAIETAAGYAEVFQSFQQESKHFLSLAEASAWLEQ